MTHLLRIAAAPLVALSLVACQHTPRQSSGLTDSPLVLTSKADSIKAPLGGALDDFRAAVSFEGGDTESAYRQASESLLQGQAVTDRVRMQIDRIDQAGQRLFAQWEREIADYHDPAQKQDSQELLAAARARHDQDIARMNASYQTMLPVLSSMTDLTLSLRHRLYDVALGEVAERGQQVSSDIREQISDVQEAIDEAKKALDEIDR